MFRVRSVVSLSVLLVSCGGGSSHPITGVGGGGGGVLTAKATDPSGDTFGKLATQWDLTGLTIVRDTGGITFTLDFTTTALSPVKGDTNAIYGELDFDVDQNSATGTPSLVDSFGPGSTGMGVDYVLDLFDYSPDSLVPVLRYNAKDSTYTVTGTVKPSFSGTQITGRIPRSALGGDDGFLNAAVIVGTLLEPTDITPNSGHLKVGGTGPVAPVGRVTVETPRGLPSRRAAWTR